MIEFTWDPYIPLGRIDIFTMSCVSVINIYLIHLSLSNITKSFVDNNVDI
jgi:hypothetical protein